ncbi:MAG: MFS transporter [Candidatus Dormibacteria bacterium]
MDVDGAEHLAPTPLPLPVPTAAPEEQAAAASLEADLVADRSGAIGALLVATTLLRIGTSGAGVAVGFDLVDLFGGRPSGTVVGLIGATQALPEMVFAPILARFADRFGRRLFIVGGPALSVVGALLLALAGQTHNIVVARLIEGIGAAAFVPTALGTIAAATTHNVRARVGASGAFEAANLAGYAGGFVVGPFAYHALHRGAFVILAALYLLAALTCLVFVPRIPPLPVSSLSRVLGAIVGPGPIRAFLPAWMAAFALLGSYVANIPALLRRATIPEQTLVHHFDERLVSAVLVGYVILLLIGIVLWTPIIPRLGAVRSMRRAAPGAMLIGLSLLAMNHLPIRPLWAVLLVPLVTGVVVLAGFGPAAVTYLAEVSETFVADRSALMAFYTVALAGGGAIGSVLGGIAVRLAYGDGLFIFGLILAAVAYLCLGPVLRYERALARTAEDAAIT